MWTGFRRVLQSFELQRVPSHSQPGWISYSLLGEDPESNKSSKPSYQEHQSNMVGEMVINGYNQSRKKYEYFRTTTSRVSLSWILKVLDLETQDEAWWYGNILQQQVSSMSHIFRDWTSFNNCNKKKHLKALDGVVNLASHKGWIIYPQR